MNTSTDQHTDSKLQRLIRWHAGEVPGPWQIVVFPTNRCNLKCNICWQRYVEEKWGKLEHHRELPDERLLELVDEAASMGAHEWSVAGGGEPFVRAELVLKMCERIRKHGMNGGIFTNGTLLRREHLERLIDMGWQRLDISLDGPDAEINDAIRSRNAFERCTAALRLLDEIKRAGNKTLPEVDAHTVLTRLNVDKMAAMARLVSDMGVKRLGFSFLQVESAQCEPYALTEQQWQRLPVLAEETYELCSALGIATNAGTLNAARERGGMRARQQIASKKHLCEAGCFEPFLSVTILAEGQVGPCCAFWDEHADNLRDKSLQEVWTGAWFQNLREKMMANDFPDFCAHCPSHFIWQTEETRRELVAQFQMMRPKPLGLALTKSVLASIRKNGWRKTGTNAWDWLALSWKYYIRSFDLHRKCLKITCYFLSRVFKTFRLLFNRGPYYSFISAKAGIINTAIFFKNHVLAKKKATCPCCGWRGHDFYWIDCGNFIMPHAECPNCQAQERQRFMHQFLNVREDLKIHRGNQTIIHFAPEEHIFFRYDAENNPRYFGVDNDFDRIKRLPFSAIQLDIQNLPFMDNSVDIVFCLHILEHIPDDHAGIREIHRILKPGGKAIIMVPFMLGQEHTIEYDKPDPAIFNHVRGYSPNDFSERLNIFSISAIYPDDLFTEEQIERHKIPSDSQIIFECTKQ